MFKVISSLVAIVVLVSGSVCGQAPCEPMPAATGDTVEVWPAQASTLRQTVAGAATGTSILLHDGTYDLTCGDAGCRLVFATPGVTLRSFSGDREAVILDAGYLTNELVSIYATDVVIADITLMRAYDHPIHITGPGSPISDILIHNVHIIDPGQQAIKINPDGSGIGVTTNSTIQCSLIELTDAGRAYIRDNCYTGGIDGHATSNLVVRQNRIEGFWCDDGLSEHGVHLWRASSGTIVEGNLILDCARGIGFGLGYGTANGHVGGIIRNNFVGAASNGLADSPDGFDTGIGLESADGALVLHNTVATTFDPASSSIEWRWDLTTAEVSNNLTNHDLLARDGAIAMLDGNISTASLAWFLNPGVGDLHLVSDDLEPVGAATPLVPGLVDVDFDGFQRDSTPDVGADEYSLSVFNDDFESGGTGRWSVVVF